MMQGIRSGRSFSGKERNQVFLNRNNLFENISQISGANHIGDSKSFAQFDYNRDGKIDLVVSNANAPRLKIFENKVNSNNFFIAMRFEGGNDTAKPSQEWSNRDGYGVKVKVYLPDMTVTRELRCGEGFNAQNSTTMLIGIGKNNIVPEIKISWPSGKQQVLKNIKEDSLVTVHEKTLSYEIEKYSVELPQDRYVKHAKPQFTLQKYSKKSKINLFITMATWCDVCKRDLPYLKQLRQTFSAEQLAITGLAISDKDSREDLEKYQQTAPYNIYNELTTEEKTHLDALLTKKLYSATVLPSYIITDADNNVLVIDLGLPSISKIKKLLYETNNE